METIARTESASRRARAPPVSVWLMEDNHAFRNTVARALGRVEGVECSQHFSNAEDALDAMLGGGVPDVMLLDVNCPARTASRPCARSNPFRPPRAS